MRKSILGCAVAGLAVATLAAGCGASGSRSSGAASGGNGASATPNGSAGALSAEANSAASGDIPDNQVFVTLHDAGGGYSMQYPEGWVQRGGGANVTLQDKNNLVHVVVLRGPVPSATAVAAALQRERRSTPSLHAGAPRRVTVAGMAAVKLAYSTLSAANPVTGKRVLLVVDRY